MKKLLSVLRAVFAAPEAAPVLSLRMRIVCGLLVGVSVGCFTWQGLASLGWGARDFGEALSDAQALLHHRQPYSESAGFDHVPYPLTAALFAMPFAGLAPVPAGALFAGISAGLLAFGITRRGLNRLAVLLCYPFWSAVLTVQWSPLLMAAGCLPWLFPVVIAKPNLGLPIALRSATRAGITVALALILLTIWWVPGWPTAWRRGMAGYQGFLPLVSIAGCLLLLAGLRYRDPDARFLLLMGVIPQRWFYDALLLWFIPATTKELLATALISWGAFLLTPEKRTREQVELLSVAFNYLPMLAVVLLRRQRASAS